jgi:hypothetical protein
MTSRGTTAHSGALLYFLLLTPGEQWVAIRRMSAQGWSDHGIATATKLAVEQVRRVLAEQAPGRANDAESQSVSHVGI